jgi:hypothetical protein
MQSYMVSYPRRFSPLRAPQIRHLSKALQKIVYILIPDQHLLWLLIALVLVAKFSVNVACYCVYLQCMELYPTSLRQTGTSLGVLVSTLIGSFSPYIAYLVNYSVTSVCKSQ